MDEKWRSLVSSLGFWANSYEEHDFWSAIADRRWDLVAIPSFPTREQLSKILTKNVEVAYDLNVLSIIMAELAKNCTQLNQLQLVSYICDLYNAIYFIKHDMPDYPYRIGSSTEAFVSFYNLLEDMNHE